MQQNYKPLCDGKFGNRQSAYDDFIKNTKKYREKINKPREKEKEIAMTPEMRIFFKQLDYVHFGHDPKPYIEEPKESKKQTIPKESEKLDTAAGGEDIPDLETEEEAEKIQKGQGLKVMTLSQLVTRLPILLSQIAAGSTSNKLKNEIRKIIYSLYRSKNLSKTIYNHLINAI